LTSSDVLPAVAVAVVLACAFVTVGAVRPLVMAPLLIVAGALASQPNIFGFRYSGVGVAFMVAGAGVAFVQDRLSAATFTPTTRALRSPITWVAISYVWLLLRVALVDGAIEIPPIVSGGAISIVSMLAVLVTVANPARALVLAKLFAGLVILVCGSYAVTLLIWLATDFGGAQVKAIAVGSWPTPQPVYFPFTTTVSQAQFLGITIPRFTGIGREPGWMALYCIFAFFLVRRIFPKRRVPQLLLLVGLAGTVSTAGFGVFVGSFALALFLRRRASTPGFAMLRTGWYFVLAGGAVWLILFAPVLGVSAKGSLNAVSAFERTTSTNAGVNALLTNPFPGGQEAAAVGGVNLVATIAAYGVIYSAAILLAVLGPLRSYPHKRALLTLLSPIAITLLAAQPPRDSTWVYCLVILAVAITLRAPAVMAPAAPTRVEPVVRPLRDRARGA
jgi:hypothetical protein